MAQAGNQNRLPKGLHALPVERQEAIVDRVSEGGPDGEIKSVLKWLAEDGIHSSRSRLSEFLLYHKALRDARESKEAILAQAEHVLEESENGLTPEIFRMYGQTFFEALAVKTGNDLMWARVQAVGLRMQKIELTKRAMDQAERKLKLLEDREARVKGAMTDRTLTEEERRARVREILGIPATPDDAGRRVGADEQEATA